jgi:hypothetical protein
MAVSVAQDKAVLVVNVACAVPVVRGTCDVTSQGQGRVE